MGTVWQPHQAKQFAKQLTMGKTYYVVRKIETRGIPWEDPQMWDDYTFTKRQAFTGIPHTEGGMGALALCQTFGPVYEDQPKNMRRVGSPGPQVAGPLGSNDYEGYLDEAELRGLEKQVGQGSDPRKRNPLSGRRP